MQASTAASSTSMILAPDPTSNDPPNSCFRKRSQSMGGGTTSTGSSEASSTFILPDPRPSSAASLVHQDPCFDPTTRIFTEDELRPQPILRKRKKQYVADEQKTEKYWEKRAKNNNAARRSREAKRLRENQVWQVFFYVRYKMVVVKLTCIQSDRNSIFNY